MARHEEAPGPAMGARGSNVRLAAEHAEISPRAPAAQGCTLRSVHDEAGRFVCLEVFGRRLQGLEVAR